MQRWLAMWLCSYFYALRPRLLVPISLAVLMSAYNTLSEEPLSGLEQLSLALGFLSYKAALLTKVIDDVSPKNMYSEQAYRPSVPRLDDDNEALALDRWGRPLKQAFRMPTDALPEDVDTKDMGLLPNLIMQGAESLDDEKDEPRTPDTSSKK